MEIAMIFLAVAEIRGDLLSQTEEEEAEIQGEEEEMVLLEEVFNHGIQVEEVEETVLPEEDNNQMSLMVTYLTEI